MLYRNQSAFHIVILSRIEWEDARTIAITIRNIHWRIRDNYNWRKAAKIFLWEPYLLCQSAQIVFSAKKASPCSFARPFRYDSRYLRLLISLHITEPGFLTSQQMRLIVRTYFMFCLNIYNVRGEKKIFLKRYLKLSKRPDFNNKLFDYLRSRFSVLKKCLRAIWTQLFDQPLLIIFHFKIFVCVPFLNRQSRDYAASSACDAIKFTCCIR